MKHLLGCVVLLLASSFCHADSKLDKVLNIDKSTVKDWENMIDNGGFFDTDRWQGIPVKNIAVMHNRDTGKITSFEISYAVSKAAAANSPKKLRSILEKYCKIPAEAWSGDSVSERAAAGARCSAEYDMKGDVGHFLLSKKD